ncbi:MAG: Cadmium-transporting ATPase [Chlamydiales bacterium]|nr:Cadmium-transporting ATPase [Chlamydiales bacterium]MCH9619419.1 Cadmium-transporting ATPase [Chlamydiales bacterium]MCH9622223.1 Cadmium-transporting ATPase [Chlamydiales bacterium]
MTQFFSSIHTDTDLFEPFFDSGMEESISPFLTPSSRRWGKNVTLKASVFAAVLLLFSFALSFFPQSGASSDLLLLFTYFFAGVPALISALDDLKRLEINIDVLMVLAAFLSVFLGSGKEGGLLLVLFSFSSAMEQAVSTRAKGAIRSLKKLSPRFAYVVQADGTLLARSVRDVSPGTLIQVKAGGVIPLDGVVVSGRSSINLVHITGENLPVVCEKGDAVQAGGSNLEGSLTISVTHTNSDSTIARIIRLISSAQETKPKLQRWFDRVTNRYAMSIIALSFFFALSIPFFSPLGFLGKEGSIYRALAFLIAASPCALILAMPIAYLSAISSCARQGILLKGGVTLDALARCKTVAMDKTGTLTEGKLSCVTAPSGKPLEIAFALEQHVDHPIAKAVCLFAKNQRLQPAQISDFKSIAGSGIEGIYQGEKVYMGNAKWIGGMLGKELAQTEGNETHAFLLIEKNLYLFSFKDMIRKEALQTVKNLQEKRKMEVVMLTGDHEASAKAVAKEAHLKSYHANLMPEDKLRYIIENENLVMIGDGINDAPALTQATVGIAMGKNGTDTAISAADIVLLQDNIDKLDWLLEKADHCGKIVKQNVTIAGAAICFATLPALLGYIPLWLAVLLHEGGTVIVGLNALRLLRK